MTDMETIKANREKWLTAMESGEYTQAQGRLQKTDKDGNKSFCCLGLACHLIVGPRKAGKWHNEGTWLPDAVADKLGIPTSGEGFTSVALQEGFRLNGHRTLAVANDTGATFAEIHAFIRAHPEAVFKKGTY